MGEVKLSNRIRQNSEAAPWVVDAVKLLEAERDALKAEVMLYRNKMGRIAIALFGEQNNVTDEACIERAANVVEELADTNGLFQDAITLAQMNKDRLDAALAEVAKLRAENNVLRNLPSRNPGKSVYPEMVALRAEVAQIGSYCQTLTDAKVELAAELGEAQAEVEKLRAENTTLRTLVAIQPTACIYCGLTEMAKCASGFPGCARADDLMCGEDEAFKAVVAERNKLRAACAAKDEAIGTLRDHITVGMYRAVPHLAEVAASALSDDAGKGWIDATGAVETVVQEHDEGGVVAYGVIAPVPDAWAGATVKIVRVKP